MRPLLCIFFLTQLISLGAQAVSLDDDIAQKRADWLSYCVVGVVSAYGANAWWSGNLTRDFKIQREGWFTQNTYTGGADKLGHAYTTYLGTRVLAGAYQGAGLSKPDAIRRAAWISLGTQMGVEILDGFSKNFRFSPEDAVMNLAGVGTALLFERFPEIDRVIDWRLLYRRSQEAQKAGIKDPIEDSSGQTYLLAIKASGFDTLARVPGLRYLELVLGYGTRGYRPTVFGHEPARHLYAGLSLNLAEILNVAVFESGAKPSQAKRMSNGVLEYFQVPGTALLHDRPR